MKSTSTTLLNKKFILASKKVNDVFYTTAELKIQLNPQDFQKMFFIIDINLDDTFIANGKKF